MNPAENILLGLLFVIKNYYICCMVVTLTAGKTNNKHPMHEQIIERIKRDYPKSKDIDKIMRIIYDTSRYVAVNLSDVIQQAVTPKKISVKDLGLDVITEHDKLLSVVAQIPDVAYLFGAGDNSHVAAAKRHIVAYFLVLNKVPRLKIVRMLGYTDPLIHKAIKRMEYYKENKTFDPMIDSVLEDVTSMLYETVEQSGFKYVKV